MLRRPDLRPSPDACYSASSSGFYPRSRGGATRLSAIACSLPSNRSIVAFCFLVVGIYQARKQHPDNHGQIEAAMRILLRQNIAKPRGH